MLSAASTTLTNSSMSVDSLRCANRNNIRAVHYQVTTLLNVQILFAIVFLLSLSCSIGYTILCREVSEACTGSGYGSLLRQERIKPVSVKNANIKKIRKRTTLSYPVLMYYTAAQLHLKPSNRF
jgi:hypothetical protein